VLKEGAVHFLSPKEMVNPAAIEEVYGVKVIIGQVNEYQVIIPVDGDPKGAGNE